MANSDATRALDPTVETEIETTTTQAAEDAPTLAITLEGAVYALLVTIVLLMHVLRLGIVPLTVPEVPRALAAWQASQPTVEQEILPDSALLQRAHMLSFTIFGTSEAASRAPTALIGFLLVFTPLLFRDLFGRGRTLIMVLLLACSPVLLASSRLDSPVIWGAFFAVLTLWAVYRRVVTGRAAFAVLATVLLVTTAFLTGPTGYVLALTLLVALLLGERIARERDEDNTIPPLNHYTHNWAWLPGLGIAALVVVLVATGFMLHPGGLNALAQSVGAGLAGWWQPVVEDAPLFFGLFASFFYEAVFWLFAGLGAYWLLSRDDLAFVDAFFAAWFLVAALALVFYRGTTASHALWLTLPMAGLASYAVQRILEDTDDGFIWYAEEDSYNSVFGMSVPLWARWVTAGAAALLFSLVLMHLGWFARELLTANFTMAPNIILESLGLPLLSSGFVVAMLVVWVFAFASFFGMPETLRGGAVGLLVVGLLTSLGTGWQVTVSRADDPTELWHPRAYGEEAFILRETLLELAERETEGFPQLEVAVVVDGENIHEHGIIAWALRDFENVTYVPDATSAQQQPVVLTPVTREPPELGGNYVGQSLVIARDWDMGDLLPQGVPAWYFQRRTRTEPQPVQEIVLWVRQDVYDGVRTPEF